MESSCLRMMRAIVFIRFNVWSSVEPVVEEPLSLRLGLLFGLSSASGLIPKL